MPSGPSPSRRWRRANSSTSAAVEQIAPAGPAVRGSPQAGAGRSSCPRLDVPDRGAEAENVLGQRHGVGHRERLDEPGAQQVVPDGVRDDLEHAAEDREARVAVRHRRAERMHLRKLRTGLHVPLETVVAATGVGEVVAVDAARVREQVTDRHRLGHLFVGHPEARQVAADRRVELHLSLVDELHRERCGPDLRDRADLEQRIRGRLDAGGEAEDAGRRGVDLVLAENGHRGRRHAVSLAHLLEPCLERRHFRRGRHRQRASFSVSSNCAAPLWPGAVGAK